MGPGSALTITLKVEQGVQSSGQANRSMTSEQERQDVEPSLGTPSPLLGCRFSSWLVSAELLSSPCFSLSLASVSQDFGSQFRRVAMLRTEHRVPVEIPGAKSKVGAEAWQHLCALSACVVMLLRDPARQEPTSPLWWPHIDCGAQCNSGHCL